jgi:hypothetical protein
VSPWTSTQSGFSAARTRRRPQHGCRQVNQILFRPHQCQIVIGHKLEEAQYFIQHVAVLAGHAENGMDRLGGSERLDHRRHLDRFWPGTENDQNFHLGASVIGGVASRSYSGGVTIFRSSAGRFLQIRH